MTVAQHAAHPLVVGKVIVWNLGPTPLVPTAMSGARHKQSRENALYHKQVKLITMHSWDFSDKGRAIKRLVVCWMFLNLISLGVTVLHVEM